MGDEDKYKITEETKDVHSDIDQALRRIQKRDKIQLVNDVKVKPPTPGKMNVDLTPGKYAIDLSVLLAAQLSDCPATVIPMLIDHAVRTNIDIKEAYKPEKRILDFHFWWIIILVGGLVAMLFLIQSLFGVFG